MIKVLNSENDIRDIITGFPEGVLDKVTKIEYYTTGNKSIVINPDFEKVNDTLVVVIPSQALKVLPSGVLYRKASYKDSDEKYPDQTYDLEIVDNMDIWLESNTSSGDEPISPDGEPYLTQSDFKTINGQSIVGQGDIRIDIDIDEQEVRDIIDSKLTGYAKTSQIPTKTSQLNNDSGFITQHQTLKTINGQSIIGSGNITIEGGSGGGITMEELNTKLLRYATQEYVANFYVKESDLKTINGQSIIGSGNLHIEGGSGGDGVSMEELTEILKGYALNTRLNNYSTISNVNDKITEVNENLYDNFTQKTDFKTINGQSILGSGNITVTGGISTEVLKDYALKTDIPSLAGYATEAWVDEQGFLHDIDLTDMFRKSLVFSGSETEWNKLPDSEKDKYIIALIYGQDEQ